MTAPKYKITWKTFAFPAIGLTAFFAYIYLFNVDLQEIISKAEKANLGIFLLAAIATLFDTLFFTLAWDSLLDFLQVKISLFRQLMFVWIGIFVDTLIPAESVSGELARIFLVNRDQQGTAGKATASVVIQRLIGVSINVLTLGTGGMLLLSEHRLFGMIFWLTLFLMVVTAFFFIIVLLLCMKQTWTIRIVDVAISFAERISRGKWKMHKIREEAVDATKAFHNAIKEYLHAPKTLLIASAFSGFSWLCTLAVFYLTFQSIGYSQISWSAILATSSIFVAVKSIPIGVPFEVGLPEITLTTLFIAFGVPPEISATATVLSRLLTLWLRFFIGFLAQQWIGIKGMATVTQDGETLLKMENA